MSVMGPAKMNVVFCDCLAHLSASDVFPSNHNLIFVLLAPVIDLIFLSIHIIPGFCPLPSPGPPLFAACINFNRFDLHISCCLGLICCSVFFFVLTRKPLSSCQQIACNLCVSFPASPAHNLHCYSKCRFRVSLKKKSIS